MGSNLAAAFAFSLLAMLLLSGCASPGQGANPSKQTPNIAPSAPAPDTAPAQFSPPASSECYGMGCSLMAEDSGNPVPYRPLAYSEPRPTRETFVPDGGTFALDANIIKKELYGKTQYLYGYNSQLPGPAIRVKQGSKITINFRNNLDSPTTVHWHGLRLENRFDGVPNVTQDEVEPGGNFTYELIFPDEGIYWYHPHVREEVQQERGLYGAILVDPAGPGYFSNASKEEVIFLDDILLGGTGEPYPFHANFTDFAAMGRYGNRPLINGEEKLALSANTGEVVRLFLINTANVRPFSLKLEGAKLKVIGGDSGKFETPYFAESLTIAPSERYIAEVSFEKPGTYRILNSNPLATDSIGEITVSGKPSPPPAEFLSLSPNREISDSISPYKKYFDAAPDFEYELKPDIPGATVLEDLMEHTEDGIEWEDTMFYMNQISTSELLTWNITDKRTGKSNMDASASVEKGKPIKIRIFNPEDSLHPMQHPIHIHGTRFLVLAKDGKKNDNLVWKDTVLIPIGSNVDLLVEFPNEGEWMMHCHIAEHLGSGMMTSFKAE